MTALQGLRVLDLSHNRVGAQVSQLFADFGADVVWVEPPGGAAIRSEAAFPFWARGKSSVEIDLRSPAGQAAIRRLASDADVLVETFRPGVLDRYGLGYEDLAELNPRLVYTSVTGFGSIGPNVNVKGYEALVAAKLGVLQTFAQLTAPEAPPFAAVPWCSFSASQVALHGTLAALIERESSGSGQRVEASLAQAFTALDTWSWFERLIEHKWPGAYKRVANFDAAGEPTSPFPYFLLVALTSDGHWLQFAQVAPHLFKALMDELGLTWMFTDPAWAGIPVFEDVERRAQLWRKMLEAANTKTLAEWTAVFDSNPNVFAEVFRSSSDILEHPQLVADQMVLTINDHEHGPVTQPGPLAKLYTTPAIIDRSAPALGGTASFSDAPAGHDATEVDTAAGASGLPLEGITVVEFAGLFAAPHGATLLTDLGARVIKVEPLDGDPIRKIIPFPESGGAKVMQGKESICIDVGTDEGLALAHRLVESADVVLQGYRAGVAERMGLGYDRLRSINPTLVYLNAPGYGVGAPFGHRPAYAPSIGAAVGIARTMVGNRAVERAGMTMEEICNTSRTLTLSMNSNAQADGFAALGVATAMLLGLLARKRGTGGQEILTTMLNTGGHAMSAQAVQYAGSVAPAAPGDDMRGPNALYRMYDSADGWVFLAAPAPSEWNDLVTALQPHIDLSGDQRFATAESRSVNDAALTEVLAAVLRTRPGADWERDLTAADVGCVVVSTDPIEHVLWSDEVGRASGYVVDVVHPTFEEHPRMASLVRLSRSATQAKPGVLPGQNTDAILSELGFDATSISSMRERSIVA